MADEQKEELFHLALTKNQLQGLIALTAVGEMVVRCEPALHSRGGVAFIMTHEQTDKFHMCLLILAGCESQAEFQRTDDNELDYRIRQTIRSSMKALTKMALMFWKDHNETSKQLSEILKRMQARG